MKALVYSYKHYGIEEVIKSIKKKNIQVDVFGEKLDDNLRDDIFQNKMKNKIEKENYDFVFSFNFYPIISNICKKYNIKYISWVYDSPLISLYSYTVINECNYIFLFDSEEYVKLRNAGINTVFYLPLAVDTDRFEDFKENDKYKCDISFVGALYDEPKNALYKRLYNNLSDYMKGYLDAVVNSQLNLYGVNILENSLDNNVVKELQKSINVTTNPDGVESPAYVYSEYFLSRRVTELERKNIIKKLSSMYQFYLYTNDESRVIGNSINKGRVDYYNEMPYVFKNSKINLNISLKSIKSGIPLRVFDIMGSGGFLITNYQSEMLEYFEPNVDFVYYEDMLDLENKVSYYLNHDLERLEIAKNGYNKVKLYHSYDIRVEEMLEIIKAERK